MPKLPQISITGRTRFKDYTHTKKKQNTACQQRPKTAKAKKLPAATTSTTIHSIKTKEPKEAKKAKEAKTDTNTVNTDAVPRTIHKTNIEPPSTDSTTTSKMPILPHSLDLKPTHSHYQTVRNYGISIKSKPPQHGSLAFPVYLLHYLFPSNIKK
jgi:hypothetical protein